MAKQIMDICSGREVPGREKKVWAKHGIVVIGDDGRMSIKIESLPVGGWDGWLSVFEQKPRDNNQGSNVQNGGDGTPF